MHHVVPVVRMGDYYKLLEFLVLGQADFHNMLTFTAAKLLLQVFYRIAS